MRASYWERRDKVKHNSSDFTCTQIRWQVLVTHTFFLCSFWRSLNCSILFTSSFSNPASWMCKFPTFSISNKDEDKKRKSTKWAEVLNTAVVRTQAALTCFHFIERCPQSAAKTERHTRVRSRCVFESQLLQMRDNKRHSPDLIKAPGLAGDRDQLFAIFLLCRCSKKQKKMWNHSRAEPHCCLLNPLNGADQPTSFSAGPPRLCRSVDRHWVAGW